MKEAESSFPIKLPFGLLVGFHCTVRTASEFWLLDDKISLLILVSWSDWTVTPRVEDGMWAQHKDIMKIILSLLWLLVDTDFVYCFHMIQYSGTYYICPLFMARNCPRHWGHRQIQNQDLPSRSLIFYWRIQKIYESGNWCMTRQRKKKLNKEVETNKGYVFIRVARDGVWGVATSEESCMKSVAPVREGSSTEGTARPRPWDGSGFHRNSGGLYKKGRKQRGE